MQELSDRRHIEDATLTKAVETLFRKLIRFLVGRISLIKLQEMIRTIFIEEAENQLRRESPEKNVSLTKLALMSGLDTRTITKIRNGSGYRRPFHNSGNFLSDLTPGALILDVWNSKPPYFDPTSGRPRSLDVAGGEVSFEALFSDSIKGRGVTANSLLRRLVESGSVQVDAQNQKVSISRLTYLATDSADDIGAMEMGFGAIGSLIDTVLENLSNAATNKDRLFQRGAWTFRLSTSREPEARAELSRLLEETDNRAREILTKYEERGPGPDQLTAGVGYYYFREAGGSELKSVA